MDAAMTFGMQSHYYNTTTVSWRFADDCCGLVHKSRHYDGLPWTIARWIELANAAVAGASTVKRLTQIDFFTIFFGFKSIDDSDRFTVVFTLFHRFVALVQPDSEEVEYFDEGEDTHAHKQGVDAT